MNDFTRTIINGLKTYIQKSRGNWNQNDETAVDYIKNRTHWSEVSLVKILPETTVYIASDCEKISKNIILELGKTYNVMFNGKEYECIAWTNDEAILIGNGSIYGGRDDASGNIGGNGEPFSCDSYEDGSFYLNVSESGTYTIKISGKDEVIHKIDKKYLPENMKNILDGSAKGSVRTIEAYNEIGRYAFAEGYRTTASGNYSHAEGYHTTASNDYSHAEGSWTNASGGQSHAEGDGTTASGYASHAEGIATTASKEGSHAEGWVTTASSPYQHVQGKYNIEDASNTYAHIVGNGNFNALSNAHTLDWNGNAWFSGDIYTGSTSGKNKDEGSKKLATEEYVATELANLVGTAPETLDTIEELATAFQENEDVVETLNQAIGNKADKTDLEAFATKEYVDEKLSTTGSIPRLVTHTFPITATEEGQTVFTIGLESFNSLTDTVMVQDGRTMLFPNVDFTVVDNTVVLTEGWNIGDTGGIYVFRVEMYYPLTNIAITTPPTKTTYYQDEYFDVTGMVVTATYTNGTTKEITNYSYAPNGKLASTGTNAITISYSENGVTKTCELNIEVLFDETILQDFTYVNNGDGTYSLTGWKGTKNGVPSTEIVIPDNNAIIW